MGRDKDCPDCGGKPNEMCQACITRMKKETPKKTKTDYLLEVGKLRAELTTLAAERDGYKQKYEHLDKMFKKGANASKIRFDKFTELADKLTAAEAELTAAVGIIYECYVDQCMNSECIHHGKDCCDHIGKEECLHNKQQIRTAIKERVKKAKSK